MKILKNVVLSALLTTSTMAMAMADDSVVAGASNDIIGVPAGALLLTELEKADVRGKALDALEKAELEHSGCWNYSSCLTFEQKVAEKRQEWEYWVKMTQNGEGTPWQKRWKWKKRKASY